MKILRVFIGFSFSVLFSLSGVYAQYYNSGQDPASVRWQQINTANFKIIFPADYSNTANRVANILEYAASLDTITLNTKVKKIPVILHNQMAISNAQTVWAPRRMNFYTAPPQDSYGQDWFEQLSLHEYRHIIQLSKLNQGLTQVLTYAFGEQITAAVLGLYIPLWFLEGDAVAAETELSKVGRGRSPGFAMPLRAQFINENIYSYDKATFGSYKDFVPNHYILGYHIVAKARQHYGSKIWDHTLDKVGRRPYIVVPFSEGIRDISGMNKTGLYKSMMGELKNEWEAQADIIAEYSETQTLSPPKTIFTQYLRPHLTTKNTIVAEKKALDDIARFVEIDRNGNERSLFTPGFYLPGSLSYANGLLAWNEYGFDPRWDNRTYALVKIFDSKTGTVKVLRKNTRYYAPALSADGEKIVVVEVSENQKYKLVILDTENGQILCELSTPENYFFSYPSFSDDGQKVVAAAIGDFGNRIVVFDLSKREMTYLSKADYTEIFSPVFWGDKIAFVGAWSGINNLYALDTTTLEISKFSSVTFGLTDPFFAADGSVIFSNYTSQGYQIAKMQNPEPNKIPLREVSDHSVKLYEALARQADTILDPYAVPEKDYPHKKYSKAAHLFNIHSWAPASIDANNYDIKPGVSLLSQNVLSSAFASLGWEYDLNEETGKYYFNFTYEGWYPALDFKADYGRRKSYKFDTTTMRRIDYSWMETNFSTTIRLPLNFTTSKYSRFIQPSIQFEYVQLDMDDDAELSFKRSNYKALSYRLYAYNLLKSTDRDMNPRWGQTLDVNYRTAPFASDTLGAMLAAESRLFFPGILRHHSFNFYGGFQKRMDENPLFGNIIRLPRGFSGIYTSQLQSLSVNYKLPLFYPDFSLSSLAYLKRFKINLFYDYAFGEHFDSHQTWQSLGAGLFVDLHILRFLAPVELGYRFIYRPDYNDVKSEFLFAIRFESL